MKLNPDLIRDILLTVEDNSTFEQAVEYRKDDYSFYRLANYSHEEIIYHIRQCDLANLLSDVHYYDGGTDVIIVDLTPSGHEFINNIRESSNWNKIKFLANKVGSFSIPVLQEIASNVIFDAISHLKL